MLVIDSMADERFTFQVEGDEEVYSLPPFNKLPVSYGMKFAMANSKGELNEGVAFTVLVELLDNECPGLTEKLNMGQLEILVNSWQAAASVSVGESQA